MKKLFLLNLAALVVLFSLLSLSCKKKTNQSTYATPANNRIMSYSKFTDAPLQRPVNENFTFSYDGQQRVTQILYSTNDSVKQNEGVDQLSIAFTYSNDSIYKTSTAVRLGKVVEIDTFLQNSSGLITWAWTPGNISNFSYYGKLIAGNSLSVYDSGTVISGTSTYTSDNGDLLNHSYDGSLSVVFPDSGTQWNPVYHDTILSLPLTVTWSTSLGALAAHTVSTYSDVLTGNNTTGYPVSVNVQDPYGVVAYNDADGSYNNNTGPTWPGGVYPLESYLVYPSLTNRPGDYFQIESFTKYGSNIYQNAHLIKQIENSMNLTTINYTIDANSRITQTYVLAASHSINLLAGTIPTTTDTIVYKFQYETD